MVVCLRGWPSPLGSLTGYQVIDFIQAHFLKGPKSSVRKELLGCLIIVRPKGVSSAKKKRIL